MDWALVGSEEPAEAAGAEGFFLRPLPRVVDLPWAAFAMASFAAACFSLRAFAAGFLALDTGFRGIGKRWVDADDTPTITRFYIASTPSSLRSELHLHRNRIERVAIAK